MEAMKTASAIAIIAFVFSYILTDEGEVMDWYFRLIQRLPDWLFKPLGGCARCFAGQIALWYGFTLDWRVHIVIVALAILLTDLITKLYDRIENR